MLAFLVLISPWRELGAEPVEAGAARGGRGGGGRFLRALRRGLVSNYWVPILGGSTFSKASVPAIAAQGPFARPRRLLSSPAAPRGQELLSGFGLAGPQRARG